MSETHDPWKDVEAELARCREIAAEWGVSPDSVQLSLTPDSLVRLLAARAAEATQHRQEIAAKDETIDGLRLVALGWEKQRDEARARLAAVEAEREQEAIEHEVTKHKLLAAEQSHEAAGNRVIQLAAERDRLKAALETLVRAVSMVVSFAQSWQPLTPGDIKEMRQANDAACAALSGEGTKP